MDLKDFKELLSEDNLTIVCNDIISTVKANQEKEALDYDLGGADTKNNIKFSFDLKDNSILKKISMTQYEFLGNQEIHAAYMEFLDMVCEKLSTPEFKDKLCESFNYAIFKTDNPILNINSVNELWIEIILPDERDKCYQLIIEKEVPASILVNEGEEFKVKDGESGTGQVSHELFEINAKTGKGFNQIVLEKKKQNDPKYKYVKKVYTKRFLWECSLTLSGSLIPMKAEK